MKKESIEGINQIGRIGLVLTVIVSVACYIFMIYAIGAAILIHNAPETLAQFTVSADITVDMNLTDANMESTTVKTLQEYLEAGKGGASLGIGSLVLYLADYTSTDNGGTGVFGGQLSSFSLQDLWVALVYIVVLLAMTVVMLLFNGFFTKSLKSCKSPFEEKVVKDANNFSVLLVVWGVVTAAIIAILESIFTGTVKIGPTGIIIIVLCLVVFFFVRIWKYAADLIEQ